MFTFYEVGGKVRDELLGLVSKDIDYVAVPDKDICLSINVDIIFESLKIFLEMEGFEIFLLTPEMFTIRARFPKDHKNSDIVADFVMARKEIGYKSGTREPIIEVGTLFDDLARRDFTCNAIAKDENGDYHDPFNGIEDIKNKILKTPIHGKITFDDDPLRLIRAIRFAITKGFTISADIEYLIKYFDYWNDFKVVSVERIREEFDKCFKVSTIKTLMFLEKYKGLRDYCFKHENLWLKPQIKNDGNI
jgi:tRNA nucleotidyltransferase/poly(A) polymerase